MIRAVSRTSRLSKYRYTADETTPRSRATARSDRSGPSAARCSRAIRLISAVISARALARTPMAGEVGIPALCHTMGEHCTDSRALLLIWFPKDLGLYRSTEPASHT